MEAPASIVFSPPIGAATVTPWMVGGGGRQRMSPRPNAISSVASDRNVRDPDERIEPERSAQVQLGRRPVRVGCSLEGIVIFPLRDGGIEPLVAQPEKLDLMHHQAL